MTKSITVFVMMGVFFVVGILFAFVILPNMDGKALGSNILAISFPLQSSDLRIVDKGVEMFCDSNSNVMSFDVRENSSVISVADGVVIEVNDGKVVVDIDDGMYVEYFNLSNISVKEGSYIWREEIIGFVKDESFSLGIKNTKEGVYVCPYSYLDEEGRSIVNSQLDEMGYFDSICLCNDIEY